MRPFSLLIKPASADCNLRCAYCFYLENLGLYPGTARHRMSDATLRAMISSYMATPQPQHTFGWQGGEPTMMGIDFFRRVIEFQTQFGRAGTVVGNGLQTNATLIDDELAAHFAKYRFLLGTSLDGPAEIHDHYRRKIGGQPTHAAAVRGIQTLQRHGVEFNILVLVSKANVKRAKEIYHYFLEQRFHYLQFIPCVEFDKNGILAPFAITGEEWGDFLCEIFDLWFKNHTRFVSIRHFDSLLTLLVTGQRNICHMGEDCRQYFVVEYNGDVYPCDFFVQKPLKLGTVKNDSWELLLDSPIYQEFGLRKKNWNAACAACEFLHYCAGDCFKHRLNSPDAAPSNLSSLCAGWKRFLSHSLSGFMQLAAVVKAERHDPIGPV